jgi:hypothetical protein
MSSTEHSEATRFYNTLRRPILILSSRAGRGNVSIAEAILEHFAAPDDVHHRSIEDFLPPGIVNEDLVRYRLISSYLPLALSAMYTIPIFYYRKLLRERLRKLRLDALKDFLRDRRIATVVCVSHRQAFWTTVLKRNASLDVAVYGVLTEFGASLGWRYIFWDQMDGFISPLAASALPRLAPANVLFMRLPLPARSAYQALARTPGAKDQCLVMGGFWGQGRMMDAVRLLADAFPAVRLHVICGENRRLERAARRRFTGHSRVTVYGLVDSIESLLSRCGCVVSKPGMATLLEARAAERKIFLFRGLPVAESHNARYAIEHFGAEWLSVPAFARWLGQSSQ